MPYVKSEDPYEALQYTYSLINSIGPRVHKRRLYAHPPFPNVLQVCWDHGSLDLNSLMHTLGDCPQGYTWYTHFADEYQ